MAGNKTSGNPYSIPINYDREIGEPIIYAIRKKGYGKGTYAGMVLMQNLKDEIFAYWKEKGEDPQALWDKWFSKWSMKEIEQKEANNQKIKESHDKLVNQYVALGESTENAENFAALFPDSNPLDILRGKNYNTQNKPVEAKIEEKELVKEKKLANLKEQLKQAEFEEKIRSHEIYKKKAQRIRDEIQALELHPQEAQILQQPHS